MLNINDEKEAERVCVCLSQLVPVLKEAGISIVPHVQTSRTQKLLFQGFSCFCEVDHHSLNVSTHTRFKNSDPSSNVRVSTCAAYRYCAPPARSPKFNSLFTEDFESVGQG